MSDYAYSEDYSNFASMGYVGGSGENENRRIVIIGCENAGIDRIETFIDCGNAKTDQELLSMGSQKLMELQPVKNVEAATLPRAYIFGKDYYLGDLVTLYISRLGLEISTRVTAASEIWERERGHVTEVRFGQRLPNIFTAALRRGLVM